MTVVTGRLLGHEHDPDYEHLNGVELIRVHSTCLRPHGLYCSEPSTTSRTWAGHFGEGCSSTRPDIVLCMTDPPMVGDVALLVARRFRVPLVVVSQDVFPEIAVEVKRLRNPVLVWMLGVLTRFYLRRADAVVAIGETMRDRLETKGVPPKRLRVIPNWVDTTALTPQPRDNPWAQSYGLDGRFVVMHSGNVGHAQDLETLIRASTSLHDLEQLSVVLIGFGARHAHLVRLAASIGAEKVSFLDYQPREVLSQSLSSADVHFVGLGRGLSGYVVPSRVYGILAAGKPIIAAADEDSETARLVRHIGCGVAIPPGRPDLLAAEIRRAARRRVRPRGDGRFAAGSG